MIPENYGYAVGFQWASPERFLRISEVLSGAAKSGHKLRLEDMEQLQNDVVSLPARELQGLLRRAAQNTSTAAAKLLLDWDCAFTADGPSDHASPLQNRSGRRRPFGELMDLLE